MRHAVQRISVAALAALASCSSSGGGQAATPPSPSVRPAPATGLESAFDLVPDISSGYAQYTNWSMLGHPAAGDPGVVSFASTLRSDDPQLQQDLGIRSTAADWEVDVSRPRTPAMVVLHFSSSLAGVADRLPQFGYHRSGTLLTGRPDSTHMWTYAFKNVGIDLRRHLLVAGLDATLIRTVLAGPSRPLGHNDALEPLLTSAQAKLGDVATAATAVGTSACLPLANAVGHNVTPAALATIRKRLPGTFTHPQAELTALAHPTDTTAIDALAFPSESLAKANQPSRTGSIRLFSGLDDGNPGEIQVAASSVSGRILTFDLTAQQPRNFMTGVEYGTLGSNICP